MLSFLFPSAGEFRQVEADKCSAEKKVKSLEATIESLRQERKETARRHDDEIYNMGRTHTRTVDYLNHTVKTLNTAVSEAEERADKAEADADAKVEARVTEATLNAEATARKEVQKEVDQLRNDVARETDQSSAAQARADEKDTVIESLKDQLAGYQEFVQFIAGKMPNVDLSKFNINVDMPAPEVKVVSQGGGKKNN